MQSTISADLLLTILTTNISEDTRNWIAEKHHKIISEPSARELYLTYSLLASKIDKDAYLQISDGDDDLTNYFKLHNTRVLELARIYLLCSVLEADRSYFSPKVANLIQIADTGELETFLRYLILLPNAGDFKSAAVDSLRTNIATVFDAISSRNPYPSAYFNDQQWNQMYLKAAFMQRDLNTILDTDKRANSDLTRIISDYAHERWAASRDVDPTFWRPVSNFIKNGLLEDMKRLFDSDNIAENRAAALCCFNSDKNEAHLLLEGYPELKEQVNSGKITWANIKD
ncbi:MAG: EboA domain-containing protein [Bacteroidota bacterium]